jgi:GH15 family glucan-1,4-alpha-glucosidase
MPTITNHLDPGNLNFGLIGNCRSAAMVSETGSIEWCCLPDFSSPSVFAKLVDPEKGGEFGFVVEEGTIIKQKYLDNTNILITRFEHGEDIFESLDFMPRYLSEEGDIYEPPDIIRYIRHISGKPAFRVQYNPRLNYALHGTRHKLEHDYIKSITTEGEYESAHLYSNYPYRDILEKKKIPVKGDGYFVLSYNQKIIPQSLKRIYLHYQRTKVHWLNWTEKLIELKDYNKEVTRSALLLALLTYGKTGAIIAAPTTSLPETIGEVRNWDYRFCWIRDASMMIKTLNLLGHAGEARRFMNFILEIMTTKNQRLQIMYGIRGEKELPEKILEHLSGYKGSKPVRIGNAAHVQKQNDIYGVLLDVIYQNIDLFHVALDETEDFWTIVRNVMFSVQQNWHLPDKGIWEIRGQEKHFTFSKVLCWVAADRAIKLSRMLKMPQYIPEWEKLRDQIRQDIYQNAWDEKKQAFTQHYDSDDMDASNLLMAPYGFMKANDTMYISTVKRIQEELMHEGLMFRYKNRDDFGIPSSSFTICNFWMAKALVSIGEKEEGKKIFQRVLDKINHLGLLSEDIDFKTGRLLGNFPQGYSHLALIDTALVLTRGQTSHNILSKRLSREDGMG